MAKASVDKWPSVVIKREQIKNAPYNPRSITEQARRKLRHNLERVGLMGGLVWNKRTGNLVSGHQRISIIDSIEGKPDYELTVVQVDLTDTDEKKQNVFLNNYQAQGDFDLEKLEAVMRELGGDIETGFTETEQLRIFGKPIIEKTVEKMEEGIVESERLNEVYHQLSKRTEAEMDNFYIVLVFKNASERSVTLEANGLEVNKFFGALEFISAVRGEATKKTEIEHKKANKGKEVA